MKHRHRWVTAVALTGLLQGCGMLVVQGARHVYAAIHAPDKEVDSALAQFVRHLQAMDTAAIALLLAHDIQWESSTGDVKLSGKQAILNHLHSCASNRISAYEPHQIQTKVQINRAQQNGTIRQTFISQKGDVLSREVRFEAEWQRNGQGLWTLARWTYSLPVGQTDTTICRS